MWRYKDFNLCKTEYISVQLLETYKNRATSNWKIQNCSVNDINDFDIKQDLLCDTWGNSHVCTENYFFK